MAATVRPVATLPPSGPAGGDFEGDFPNPQIKAGAVGTAEIADGSIVDADISASAAIAVTKLAIPADAAANVAALRTLGSGPLQAASGNDSRLNDARPPQPLSVTDASVAANAAIAESKLALASDGAANIATRRTLGTGASQAAAGNDARLSDTRTPTDGSVTLAKFAFDPATQAELDAETTARQNADALRILAAEKGAANGVATLGSDGKLPSAQLPALAIGDAFPVASEAAMLALTAQRGDIAIRTDLDPDGVFILTTDSPSTLADWVQITAPGAVITVNGQTGAVVLPVDGAAGTASLRTLGTTATQAAAGNDGRLSDARQPLNNSVGTAHLVDGGVTSAKIADGTIVDADVSGSAAIAESKLALASDAAAGTPSRRTLGTGATQAVAGNDGRLADQRVPLDGSVVASKLAAGAVTSVAIADGTITDGDVSNTAAIAEAKLNLASDAAAGTASRRTLGTGATQAAAGNDARFARTLDQLPAPTGPVSANGQRLTNLADPTGLQDGVTKAYADTLRAGLDIKDSVRAASVANVALGSPGAVIDGVSLSPGDRVLLKNQTLGQDNGIYAWNGAAVTMTRTADADTSAKVTTGMAVWVEEGTQADLRFALTTIAPVTLGVTPLSFTPDGGLAQVTAGAGLTKTGNTMDVGAGAGMSVGADTVGIAPGGVGTTELAALAVTDAKVAAANKDGVAGTPGMRTLGAGAQQAAAGNDERWHCVYLNQYCVGDGLTDDSAGFRLAVAAAELIVTTALPWTHPSVVILGDPHQTYVLGNWVTGAGGQNWVILVKSDRILIDMQGATIKSGTAAPAGASNIFFVNGAGKVGDPGDYSTTWYPSRPMVALTGSYAAGATSVTVASGATFAAGDWVYIRTGQVIDNGGLPPLWPDSELNRVSSVAGNVLNLETPLSKPYAQEYYIAGTSGITSTAVTANLAPYGVHKVTDCTIDRFGLVNVDWDCPNAVLMVLVHQAVDVTLSNYTGRMGVGGTAVQYCAVSRQVHHHMRKTNPTTVGAITAGAAVGCTDVLIDNVITHGIFPGVIHIHEGVARWVVRSCGVQTAPEASLLTQGGASVRARTYGGRLLNNHFVGGTKNGVLVVDASCVAGGLISGNTLHSLELTTTSDGVVDGIGWTVDHNSSSKGILVGAGNIDGDNSIFGQPPVVGFKGRYSLGATDGVLGGGSTPSVTSRSFYAVVSASARDITTLSGGVDGQEVVLFFTDANTTLKNVFTTGRFVLNGSVDKVSTNLLTLVFRYIAANNWWVQIPCQP